MTTTPSASIHTNPHAPQVHRGGGVQTMTMPGGGGRGRSDAGAYIWYDIYNMYILWLLSVARMCRIGAEILGRGCDDDHAAADEEALLRLEPGYRPCATW